MLVFGAMPFHQCLCFSLPPPLAGLAQDSDWCTLGLVICGEEVYDLNMAFVSWEIMAGSVMSMPVVLCCAHEHTNKQWCKRILSAKESLGNKAVCVIALGKGLPTISQFSNEPGLWIYYPFTPPPFVVAFTFNWSQLILVTELMSTCQVFFIFYDGLVLFSNPICKKLFYKTVD